MMALQQHHHSSSSSHSQQQSRILHSTGSAHSISSNGSDQNPLEMGGEGNGGNGRGGRGQGGGRVGSTCQSPTTLVIKKLFSIF